MSAKIGHAVVDENGAARGGKPGDQTGKEIRVQEWYKRDGGWDAYIECTDEALADRAARNMEEICGNDNFGYDQTDRSTGYKAILAAGSIDEAEPSEFDCSSLIDAAYLLAGLEVERGYTGNLERRYLATGKFRVYLDAAHTESSALAKRGGLYLTAGKHVAMVLTDGNGATQSAGPPAEPPMEDGAEYVVVVGGSVNVRVGGSKDTGKLFTAHKGDRFPRTGAADSGWHQIQTERGVGYISNKTRYTKIDGGRNA